MASLDFWFEFASTYSYPAAMRIETEAGRRGVTVHWRPFLLGPIFAAQGWQDSPFNIYPAKGRYMWRDMERITSQLGLPFIRPRTFPQNGLLAARCALVLSPPDQPDFVRAVYRANFADGLDISRAETISALLDGLGHEAAKVLERAVTPEIKSALRANSEAAAAAGIFGAPSFTAGSELFWGNDRMEAALDWAAQSRGSRP